MKKVKNIFLAVSIAILSSCDFMDIVPDMIATIEDNAFALRSQAEKYFFNCYGYLPMTGSTTGDPALLGGDEIWLPQHNGSYNNAKNLALGYQNVSNPYFDFWMGARGGKNLYRGISDCNIFLANVDRVPDFNSPAERQRWRSEVEILKAWYHFYLIRMYGPIPIMDVNMGVGAGTDEVLVYRNTVDECFRYVVNKVDSVIKLGYLPQVIGDPANEAGRITEGIARMMKAKMLVYWASPLFNGNTEYAGLTDNRGIEIFCPDKTEEEKQQRWVEARDACSEAINFLERQGLTRLFKYTGMDWPRISTITRNKLTIRMSLTERWNSDIIWANTNNWSSDLQLQCIPREMNPNKTANTAARGNFAVPIKILHIFHSKNGVPIDEDRTWNYAARFTPRTVQNDHMFLLAVGDAQTVGIHFDRELRYYASIAFDRGIWFGHGSDDETLQFPKTKQGESCANGVVASWNVSGMWPKKLIHPKSTLSDASGITFTANLYPFPFFRLPELYLMYAEALNEASNTQEARDMAIQYVDSIRSRAGLPGVKEAWANFASDPTKPNRQSGLRDIIKKEYHIEFVFEGHRFWNLRRWKDAITEYNKPITGWNLGSSNVSEYYNETLIYPQPAKFSARDYFWPIYDQERLRNKNLVQNFGW